MGKAGMLNVTDQMTQAALDLWEQRWPQASPSRYLIAEVLEAALSQSEVASELAGEALEADAAASVSGGSGEDTVAAPGPNQEQGFVRPSWESLEAELDDAHHLAFQDALDSHSAAPNSYGAGYDQGYKDALDLALELIRGET